MEATTSGMVCTVKTKISAPIDLVWKAFVNPKDIQQWHSASQEWHVTKAVNKFVEGGSFNYRMEAKDGSAGFDFEGRFKTIEAPEEIAYELADGRQVKVNFSLTTKSRVLVIQSFETEKDNPLEMQAQGWQNILDNFKDHVESLVIPKEG